MATVLATDGQRCPLANEVAILAYSSTLMDGGAFPVRVGFSRWPAGMMVTVKFAPCKAKCMAGGGGQLLSMPSDTSSCTFRLADSEAAAARQTLHFAVSARSISGCAELTGSAYCPQLLPRPPPPSPPSLPPMPPGRPPHAPPPPQRVWLGQFLQAEPHMVDPSQWGQCPLAPRLYFDPPTSRVRVHLDAWPVGEIILVNHGATSLHATGLDRVAAHMAPAVGSTRSQPARSCRLWLGEQGKLMGDPDDTAAMLPAGALTQRVP